MINKPYDETTIQEKIDYNTTIRKQIVDFIQTLPQGYCASLKCDVCPLHFGNECITLIKD